MLAVIFVLVRLHWAIVYVRRFVVPVLKLLLESLGAISTLAVPANILVSAE
jgi:hypothetical protein